MRRMTALGAAALGLFLLSCKSGTAPQPLPEFSFGVTVKDQAGHPVPDVLVSAWNRLSTVRGPGLAARARLVETTFQFDLPQPCTASLTVYDLDGGIVARPSDRNSVSPGRHTVLWRVPASVRDGAYVCVLAATDTALQQVLFQDSIFVYHRSNNYLSNVLGLTAADGTLERQIRVFFPSLYRLGTLTATSMAGDTLGSFSVLDSVVIAVADTSRGLLQEYRRPIGQGLNHYALTWAPPVVPARAGGVSPEGSTGATGGRDVEGAAAGSDPRRDGKPARRASVISWKLYQNYPNPF